MQPITENNTEWSRETKPPKEGTRPKPKPGSGAPEATNLRSDIAYAIGYARGLGHPCTYLESRYPELTAQETKAKEGYEPPR